MRVYGLSAAGWLRLQNDTMWVHHPTILRLLPYNQDLWHNIGKKWGEYCYLFNLLIRGQNKLAGCRKEISWEVNENGCHVCTSHYSVGRGMPVLRTGGEARSMHRVLFEERYGKLRDGLSVRRKCGNRCCINFSHMKIVIPGFKSRHPHCRLSDEDVLDIRSSTDPYWLLSEIYGIGISTINKIKMGIKRVHVKLDG